MNKINDNYFKNCKHINKFIESKIITNPEYSIYGEIFSYTTNDSLKIYSTSDGSLRNIITNFKVDSMKYFQEYTLLFTNDKNIYYLSIYDNTLLRKFECKSNTILNLCVDRYHDLFMSIGTNEVNIWDIRMKNSILQLETYGHLGTLSSNNQYALCDNNTLRLFDLRNTNGPSRIISLKSNFNKSMWYTEDNSILIISGEKDYVFYNDMGERLGYVGMEEKNQGETTIDSSVLLCCSKDFLYAYRINDRKRIGIMETNNKNLIIKTSPTNQGFICLTNNSLELYS